MYGLAAAEKDGRSGFEKLIHDIVAATNDVNEFISGLLFAIVSKHLGDRTRSQFHVTGSPGPEFGLPFLMDRVFG